MIIPVVTLLLTQILLPVLLIGGLWRGRFPSKAAWLAAALGTAAFVAYFLLVGRWDWTSYYLRVAIPLALLAAVHASFRRTFGEGGLPWWHSPSSLRGWSTPAVNVLLAVLFAGLAAFAARGLVPGDERPAELSFPLKDGVYYVAQGGASPLLNYHNNVDSAHRFALDVNALNAAGTRAVGAYPSDPARYAVFGEPIHAPCAGEAVEVADGLPDGEPPETDRENLAGNHVVLRCPEEGVDVLLAHMQRGSVDAERGRRVEEGRVLGRVGNSGNTSEPHLHVHAVRSGSGTPLDGEGVPMRFDGRFPARNGLMF